MQRYGIRGTPLEWFKSYLKNRTHYVTYKNHSSDMSFLTTGVPQGSVLGPLLFIIYTNDLPYCLKKTKCILFADDTTIYASGKSLPELYNSLNSDLRIMADWFRANKLSLNVGKTVYMIFNNKLDRDLEDAGLLLKLGSEEIKLVTNTKFLGLQIDNKLKWNEHLKHVKSKLSSTLYALRAAKNVFGTRQLQTIYNSLFQPYLDYGLILWGAACQKVLKPIEIQQKKAIRLISNVGYNAHTQPLFKQHGILQLRDLYTLHINKFMFQLDRKLLPSSLQNMFTLNNEIHSHQTRNRNIPRVRLKRTANAEQSILHKGPRLWHNVSNDLKQSKTVHRFSRAMKKQIIDLY